MAGVEAAPSAGIIHRDLKPDNVIIQGAGAALTIKILDFGLAKMRGYDFSDSGSMTAPGVAVGTLGYMSPEQYLGANVDERSDVYSIGVMALETLTGKLQLNAYSFHTKSWRWSDGVSTLPGQLQSIGDLRAAFRRA